MNVRVNGYAPENEKRQSVNGHAPENGCFLSTENRVNGHAPEKGTRERACSGIWIVLLRFFVFSSCLKPIPGTNGHEKRGFE